MGPKLAYKEKLLDPKWQKRRLDILARDQFTCQICGDTETTLHIHHFCYSANPWDSDNSDLTTLCKHCHAIEEFSKTQKCNTAKVFKSKSGDITFLILLAFSDDGKWFLQMFHFIDENLINLGSVNPDSADKLCDFVFERKVKFNIQYGKDKNDKAEAR